MELTTPSASEVIALCLLAQTPRSGFDLRAHLSASIDYGEMLRFVCDLELKGWIERRGEGDSALDATCSITSGGFDALTRARREYLHLAGEADRALENARRP